MLRKTDNIRLPSSGVNSEAGAMMKTVDRYAPQTHKLDRTFQMLDKGSLLTECVCVWCVCTYEVLQHMQSFSPI